MTTEILRNILYRAAEEDAMRRAPRGEAENPQQANAETGVAASSEARALGTEQQQPLFAGGQLASIGLVVLDEVHYLADPNRGSVWEEVIINCPPSIQLLAMSATVRNPADLGGWIGKVRDREGSEQQQQQQIVLSVWAAHA
jgi:superfamily II RNA helicase